jgi:guanosine-3',5'-bis(diphosphate) 3'-pyrophosphohydrolase
MQSRYPRTSDSKPHQGYGQRSDKASVWGLQKASKKTTRFRGRDFDIFAMRIVVPTISDCYNMLGVIHEKYVPLANRFKDYIAVPKPNGYRSLHTTVVGLSGETKKAFPIEIQIRTYEMNEEAEYGIAAHWHYKEQGSKNQQIAQQSKEWVESLLEIQEHLKENQDFIQGSGSTITGLGRVYAITPGGDIKDLPKGATPIDFAFAVHSHVGLHMRLAKANGTLVPLDYKIQNGDVIEIVTSRDAKPNQNWLSLCVSSRTKSRLRSYFHSKDNDTLIREGRDMLNKQLVQYGLPELDQSLSVLKEYAKSARNKRQREMILHRIGNSSISPVSVAKEIAIRLKKEQVLHSTKPSKKKPSSSQKSEKEAEIIIGENRNIPTKKASCCNPKPGDKIVGYVTRGNHITIHRTDCNTLAKLDSRRLLDARYETDEPTKKLQIEVKRGADRVGFVNDILSIFSQKDLNLVGFVFEHRSSHSATILFTVEIENEQNTDAVMTEIEHVPGVKSTRVRDEKYS